VGFPFVSLQYRKEGAVSPRPRLHMPVHIINSVYSLDKQTFSYTIYPVVLSSTMMMGFTTPFVFSRPL